MNRTCSDCEEEKPDEEFPKEHGCFVKRCRPRYRIYKRTLPSYSDADSRRDSRLRSRYGISLEDYREMVVEQNGTCAICGNGGKLDVDHCHASGRVRGLLCGSCNRALGLLKDNVGSLERAIDYLERGSDYR